MKATIGEEKSTGGMLLWVCRLNGQFFCSSYSEQGLRMMILHKIRKGTGGYNNYG